MGISIHSPTRGLTFLILVFNSLENFNSQPHKGADGKSIHMEPANGHFNSQPHKGADSNFQQLYHTFSIIIVIFCIILSLIYLNNHFSPIDKYK